ncbi:MAG TPA: hypothetical protein VFV50_06305 [Bdellovibrionales bacterium]|nr:hypothetical protein [Bdellovibrionales bacterium]
MDSKLALSLFCLALGACAPAAGSLQAPFNDPWIVIEGTVEPAAVPEAVEIVLCTGAVSEPRRLPQSAAVRPTSEGHYRLAVNASVYQSVAELHVCGKSEERLVVLQSVTETESSYVRVLELSSTESLVK